jgi:peptidoglycan/xylan/chitin deacetylase (PgdA/CDA1 family)
MYKKSEEPTMKKILMILCLFAVLFGSCKATGGAQTGDATVKKAKLCALTFDDGPDTDLTPRVLDRLEKYDVPATFFVIGALVNDDTKPVLDRMLKLNCEIGNHSWEWSSMNGMTAEEIRESVGNTNAVIKQYTGTTPKFFRPPNLAVSDEMYDVIGLPFASGVLGFDWAGCDTDAKTRSKNVMDNMRDGAIILLHDVQPEPHPTPEALDILIPALKKQGYEFVTLSELFNRKGIDPKSANATYDMWTYAE